MAIAKRTANSPPFGSAVPHLAERTIKGFLAPFISGRRVPAGALRILGVLTFGIQPWEAGKPTNEMEVVSWTNQL